MSTEYEGKFAEQAKTLDDARRMLAEYHKCVVIRPTGFGKTWLLTELIKDFRKVLYLYPSAVIRDTVVDRYFDLADQESEEDQILDPETIETCRELGRIPGCDLMTYAKLIRLPDDDIKAMDYDLVIFDESHRMGGAKTKTACEKLFALLPESTKFIGATATPTRMDNFDMSSHFFSDRLCYAYTLHDAIQSGLILKPNYCYMAYNFKQDLEDAARDAGEDLRDPHVSDTINAKMIELSRLYNMPGVIRDVCGKYALQTSYMKFIIFFASKKHMDEKLPDVANWFQEAYPDHKISTLRISSANSQEQANTDKLAMLTHRENTIDLIACIDMLNVGYHVSDQTGIMMYRGTKSNTIFTQQLGRALSAGAGNSAIIFDIVDNLHQKAVYELRPKSASLAKRRRRGTSAALDDYTADPETGRICLTGKDGRKTPTQYHVDPESNKILDRRGQQSTFRYDPKTNTVKNTAVTDGPEKNINEITPDCLYATGHEASYREILAKAMAEPLSHRCKYALQLHFRSWCLNHGVPYPISDKELSELYGLEIQDFYDEFRKIIRDRKIAYPLQDAQSLIAVGNDGSTDAPLAICCEATGVSIDTLLNLIFA